jgi:hypothetical protein
MPRQKQAAWQSQKNWASTVYFITWAERDDGPIKIRVGRRADDRRASLQTGNHERLQIMAVMCGDRGEENRLHDHFADDRLWDEWFKRSDTLMETIASHGVRYRAAA